MRSGELARLAGVSADTIRHYERLGLLAKPPRTNGGYREYSAKSLDRVRLIRRALSVGFSLPDLAAVLEMRDRGEAPCSQVRSIAESKLRDVNQQIEDLLVMRQQLEQILKDWDVRLAATARENPAHLLEAIPETFVPHRPVFSTRISRRRS